jgi:hypothetical protein
MHLSFTINRVSRLALPATGIVLAALALASTAQAAPKDRNHDGLPDRWEHRNKLSLNVNQSQRDQDHDGVVNMCELQSGTSPRRRDSNRDGVRDGSEDADSDGVTNRQESLSGSDCGDADTDNDGVGDADENSGTITAFDGGVLTIATFAGDTVSGTVDANTKIECGGNDNVSPTTPPPPTLTATSASFETDDSGDDNAPAGGTAAQGGSGDESGDDDHCNSDALVVGTVVHESQLVNGVFVKIELTD